MAECPRCGRDVSLWGRDLLSGVCNECIKDEARDAKRQKLAEQAAITQTARIREEAEAARLEQRVRERILKIKQSMLRRLEAGLPVIVYHSIYMPVDSVLMDKPINQQFSLSGLFHLGLQGWEAIQIIPRTVGVGLKNTSIGSTMGVTWGGASGGNVAGVHVLLRKTLVPSDVDPDPDDELGKVIRSHIHV